MNQRNSTIELFCSFQPEIRQGRVAGKIFKKIRLYTKFFINQSHPNGQKKYMHENLKHTVTKHLAKNLKKYSHFQTITTNNRKRVPDVM